MTMTKQYQPSRLKLIFTVFIFTLILLVPAAVFADSSTDLGSCDTTSSGDIDTSVAIDTTASYSSVDTTTDTGSDSSLTTVTADSGTDINYDSSAATVDSDSSLTDSSYNLTLDSETTSVSDPAIESSPEVTSSDSNETLVIDSSTESDFLETETVVDEVNLTTECSEGNSYAADLTLDGIVPGSGGEEVEFTMTFTELSSETTLGSVMITMPEDGFTNYSLIDDSIVTSNGQTWEGELVYDNLLYYLYLWAVGVDDYLGQDEWVSVSFSAKTPVVSGTYVFETEAWTDSGFAHLIDDKTVYTGTISNAMAVGYSDPSVIVDYAKAEGGQYDLSNRYVDGLTVDILAEGSGFDITVLTIGNSVTSLIRLETPGRDPVLIDLSEYWWLEDSSWLDWLWSLADEDGFVWLYNDQVWLAQITVNDGTYGTLQQFVQGSYIPDVEDYFGIMQYMTMSDGTIWRFMDITSGIYIIEDTAYSTNYLFENFKYSGWAMIHDWFRFVNIGQEEDIDWKPWPFSDPFGWPQPVSDPSFDFMFDFGLSTSIDIGEPVQTLLNQSMPALQEFIGSGFVTNGTKEDLMRAQLVYWRALHLYKMYGASLSTAQKAYVETGLAVAWAAIQALEVSLQVQEGQPVALSELIEAYNLALSILEANRELLSSEALAYFTGILAEIGTLISSLSS
jgi:hypothetical protein